MKRIPYSSELLLVAATILSLLFVLQFNKSVKDVRVNELKIFLQKMNQSGNSIDHIGLVMKYRNHRRGFDQQLVQDKADLVEMRVNTILSSRELQSRNADADNSVFLVPIMYSINFFRFLIGKDPIENVRDNSSTAFIDAAYYYERNNYYRKALDIYEEARSRERLDSTGTASVLLHEGFCNSILGDYAKAREKYTAVITAYGNEGVAITAAILLRYLNGFISEIEEVLKTEDSLDKGVRLYNLIAYQESLKVLSRVEKSGGNADWSRIKYYQARCYEELAQKDKAIITYQQIVEEAPKSQFATLANRRIYIAGSLARDGEKVKELSVKNNELLKDTTLNQMVQEETKIREHEEKAAALLPPASPDQEPNPAEKAIASLEKDTPVFSREELVSYERVIKRVDTELEKKKSGTDTGDNPVPGTGETRRIKVYTTDGNIFIGTVVRETPAGVTIKTMLGDVRIERKKIAKKELLP